MAWEAQRHGRALEEEKRPLGKNFGKNEKKKKDIVLLGVHVFVFLKIPRFSFVSITLFWLFKQEIILDFLAPIR
jgi:hypothetical protein